MIVLQEDWFYTLKTENPETYILSVVCGSVGIYEITIQLDPEELKAFQLDGQPYIEKLANQIRSTPSLFLKRQRP